MNKKILIASVSILALSLAVLLFIYSNKNINPKDTTEESGVVIAPENKNPIELCFAHFGTPNERGFSDKFTLRMLLEQEKVSGELKFLPAEKDSKVGKFEGTVSPVDKIMMARKVDATWNTFGEGVEAQEKLQFTFGEGTANIDSFGLSLSDVACSDLVLRDNIENYLRTNIATLSPVKPVLGGTWYYIGSSINTSKNSGVVVYEDGHIQEKRNFTYTTDGAQKVVSLKIN